MTFECLLLIALFGRVHMHTVVFAMTSLCSIQDHSVLQGQGWVCAQYCEVQEEDENVEVAPRARAAPRRAAVASKTYIDIDESDSDVISLKDGSEGSDFEL
jgi:hypothetical protein